LAWGEPGRWVGACAGQYPRPIPFLFLPVLAGLEYWGGGFPSIIALMPIWKRPHEKGPLENTPHESGPYKNGSCKKTAQLTSGHHDQGHDQGHDHDLDHDVIKVTIMVREAPRG